MWGNAFADLAKKAQDLQEQAKEQASHISTPTFFNLDAMQQQDSPDASETVSSSAHASTAAATVDTTTSSIRSRPTSSMAAQTTSRKNDDTISTTTTAAQHAAAVLTSSSSSSGDEKRADIASKTTLSSLPLTPNHEKSVEHTKSMTSASSTINTRTTSRPADSAAVASMIGEAATNDDNAVKMLQDDTSIPVLPPRNNSSTSGNGDNSSADGGGGGWNDMDELNLVASSLDSNEIANDDITSMANAAAPAAVDHKVEPPTTRTGAAPPDDQEKDDAWTPPTAAVDVDDIVATNDGECSDPQSTTDETLVNKNEILLRNAETLTTTQQTSSTDNDQAAATAVSSEQESAIFKDSTTRQVQESSSADNLPALSSSSLSGVNVDDGDGACANVVSDAASALLNGGDKEESIPVHHQPIMREQLRHDEDDDGATMLTLDNTAVGQKGTAAAVDDGIGGAPTASKDGVVNANHFEIGSEETDGSFDDDENADGAETHEERANREKDETATSPVPENEKGAETDFRNSNVETVSLLGGSSEEHDAESTSDEARVTESLLVSSDKPTVVADSIDDDKSEVDAKSLADDSNEQLEARALPEPVVVADQSATKPRAPSPEFTTTSTIQQQEDYAFEIQRLREEHRAEIDRLTKDNEMQLQETIDSFNHEQCQSERTEMEQRFMNQLRGKDEHLQELMRANEGYQLKIDALKREVTGTQALLEQRDSAMGSVNASHNKNVELLEQKIDELKESLSLAKSEGDKVKDVLRSTKSELETSNEAYATLKARVKLVATELKERRVECRSLAATVTDVKRTNEQLETQIVNLQSQLSDRDRIQAQKENERKQLGEKIESLEMQLHKTSSALKDRDAVSEKALSAYKKKAQNALAVANARAAAANQAKEEAELEASSARNMSEEAIQRARVAETAGNNALAKAEDYVREMVAEKEALEGHLSQATETLEETKAEADHFRNVFEGSKVAEEKLVKDVQLLTHEREEERSRNRTMQKQMEEDQHKLEVLYEEVESLREELRQAASIVATSSGDVTEKEGRSGWTHPSRTSDEIPDRMDAEGTIAMLEGELRDANRAIKELKDALKNAIAEQGGNGYGTGAPASMAVHHGSSRTNPSSGTVGGNESTPLFYAMEKQAELNTARDEINRLANLLGDAESSKMEAYEAMDEMRRRMEEAEARLSRQEKFEGAAKPTAASTSTHDTDGNANLEYLKNIMLSYLNAKTLAEKKALVPVIAAVLCLTPEEQAAAIKNLEESGGIESVGKALFESFGGSMRR